MSTYLQNPLDWRIIINGQGKWYLLWKPGTLGLCSQYHHPTSGSKVKKEKKNGINGSKTVDSR